MMTRSRIDALTESMVKVKLRQQVYDEAGMAPDNAIRLGDEKIYADRLDELRQVLSQEAAPYSVQELLDRAMLAESDELTEDQAHQALTAAVLLEALDSGLDGA